VTRNESNESKYQMNHNITFFSLKVKSVYKLYKRLSFFRTSYFLVILEIVKINSNQEINDCNRFTF